MVSRPIQKVMRDREDFRRARRGREAILDSQEGLRGPPRGPGGVGRPSVKVQEGLGGTPGRLGGTPGKPGGVVRSFQRAGRVR